MPHLDLEGCNKCVIGLDNEMADVTEVFEAACELHLSFSPALPESMSGLRRVVRDGTSLLGECKIGVARAISFHHHWIAGQRSGDTKLLLRPVHVRDATTGWWHGRTTGQKVDLPARRPAA
jgi:hypothetical protein